MKRRLEEMESENHENFPLVMKIVKSYCEAKKKIKEEEDKKKRKIVKGNNDRRRGGMQVRHDSNGNLIRTGKTYAEAKKEQNLRMEEEKKKKDPEDDDHEPWEFRWSDENLASHIWRCMCRKNGVKVHEYVPRTDYHKMSGAEVRLDLLWRKVYQAEAEADNNC